MNNGSWINGVCIISLLILIGLAVQKYHDTKVAEHKPKPQQEQTFPIVVHIDLD